MMVRFVVGVVWFAGLAPVVEAQTVHREARERVQAAVDAVRHDSATVVERAWRRLLQSPDRRQSRLAALGIATIARRTYRYREADALYASLRASDTAAGDAIAMQADLGQALGFATRWRPAEAWPLLERARRAARASQDAESEAEVLIVMAGFVSRAGPRDSVRRLMRDAANLVPPKSSLTALHKCTEASFLRGESLALADSLVTQGTAMARSLGDTLVLARCLVVRGGIHEAQGRIRLGEEPMREALQLLAAARDYEGLGSAQQWMAYMLITYAQEFGVGRRMAEHAIANGQRVQNPLIVAWADLNLAQVALRVGDAVAGRRAARDAEAAFARMGDAQGELASQGILADAMMLSGDVEGALTRYAAIERRLVAVGASNAVAPNLLRRAAGLLELGRLDAAERMIDSAVALARAAGVRGIYVTSQHYWRGMVQLKRGAWDEAIESLQQFKKGVGVAATHLNLDADLRIAEAHAGAGRFALAESVFTQGSASLDRMREHSNRRDDVLRLLSGQRYDTDTDLGIATIVGGFARAGRVDAALRIAESERARWLWVRRERRLAMARQPVTRGPLDERMIDASAVQQALGPRTAILAYVTGRGGEPTTAFVISSAGLRAFDLPPIDSLTPEVERFIATLEGGSQVAALARSLGARLLDSLVQALPAGVSALRIVPDGPLHHLPFDALRLPDGRRVLERFVVSRAPSVRLAVTASRPVTTARVVAYGDPVFDARFALARLPGSAEEARTVVRAAGGRGESRLRAAAKATSLRDDRLMGASVLHLATHARVEDWGLIDNAIYLGAGLEDDGRVGADDLAAMQLGVGLVVLSGCRTVGGLVATGEGVQGLVAPILEAGAGAVVVTHWAIRDRSLIQLMKDFYEAMSSGLSAADALARAKRASLRRGDAPTVWAAATLVGDGALRPLATAPVPATDGLASVPRGRRPVAP